LAEIGPRQVDWIKADLEGTSAAASAASHAPPSPTSGGVAPASNWTIVYSHRPFYCSNTRGNDVLKGTKVLQDQLEHVLLANNVDLVVSGEQLKRRSATRTIIAAPWTLSHPVFSDNLCVCACFRACVTARVCARARVGGGEGGGVLELGERELRPKRNHPTVHIRNHPTVHTRNHSTVHTLNYPTMHTQKKRIDADGIQLSRNVLGMLVTRACGVRAPNVQVMCTIMSVRCQSNTMLPPNRTTPIQRSVTSLYYRFLLPRGVLAFLALCNILGKL
jgi:hypothetical protein